MAGEDLPLSLNVVSSDSVQAIKALIQKREGLESEFTNGEELSFEGRILKDDRELGEYSLEEDAELTTSEPDVWAGCLSSFQEGGAGDGDVGAAADAGAGGAGADEEAASKKAPPMTLIVYGDRGAGKWDLINKLHSSDPKVKATKKMPPKMHGMPLSYATVEIDLDHVAGSENSGVHNIHAWMIETPENTDGFLPVALASSGGLVEAALEQEVDTLSMMKDAAPMLSNTVVMICLDLATPWLLKASLEKWLKHAHEKFSEQVDKLGTFSRMIEKVASACYPPKLPVEAPEEGNGYGSGDEGMEPEPAAAPPPSAQEARKEMTHNAGVPIIVVCCKSDVMSKWDKEYGWEDSHREFIQVHLRMLCMEYGAALLYTSSAVAKASRVKSAAPSTTNMDVLRDYLTHRLVGGNCTRKPQMGSELDCHEVVFVPAGIDKMTLCNALLSGVFGTEEEGKKPFHAVIKAKGTDGSKHAGLEPEGEPAAVESDQDFFKRLQAEMASTSKASVTKASAGGSVKAKVTAKPAVVSGTKAAAAKAPLGGAKDFFSKLSKQVAQ